MKRPCPNCGTAFSDRGGKIKSCSYQCSGALRKCRVEIARRGECLVVTNIKPQARGHILYEHGAERTMYHRLVYEEMFGPIPDGLCVRHKCDNPPCCSPEHLILGTRADNRSDCVSRNRQAVGQKIHCAKLTEEKVREIRASNKTRQQLVEKFGVNLTTIRGVLSRKTWKHVA